MSTAAFLAGILVVLSVPYLAGSALLAVSSGAVAAAGSVVPGSSRVARGLRARRGAALRLLVLSLCVGAAALVAFAAAHGLLTLDG